ncbi:MAG: aspartate aminotransferase family protein [Candidatus Omnitrophota bacterium]|nr:MAG: aspartate aminotransferase family protein [Candidatus Omnitrophota bacterium]
MNLPQVFESYKEYIVPSYSKTPFVFVKGKGSYLWDIRGKKYLDFFPGWGVGSVGHCHPKVMTAVRDQLKKLIFVPNNYYTIAQAKLARELNFWAGFACKVFFCNSGAEANEAAIKLSRKFGQGRYEIITFENAFHGRTLATIAATGQKKYQQGFEPMPEGFKSVPFNDIDTVKKAFTDKTVAVMLELVQGEGGINVADKGFVTQLRKFCDERKLLMIIDEVQTGIGRTGKMFAWQHYGVVPDIFTVAKALGGGFPIGVMLSRSEIADCLGPGMHASTFGGGAVISRAALAVLQSIQKEKLLGNTQKMGAYLFERLHQLASRCTRIKEVRGMGLMWGIELTQEGKAIVEECSKQGLLINCTHDTVLRLMPALNVSKKQIDNALKILENALRG